MSKYNLYKIPIINEERLIAKLESVGLKLVSSMDIDNYTYSFYFSIKPTESEIWWLNLYSQFIKGIEIDKIKNLNYFALLLIKNEKLLYAISLGKAHFYIKDYCDLDFGIDLGTRIMYKNSIDIKNSRLFGGIKKKSLITYQHDSEIDLESGEAVVYLKGKTKDEKIWGKKLNCGHSAQFNIKDFNPNKLHILIEKIERTLENSPSFSIPRTNEIKDVKKKKELDIKLINAINNEVSILELDEQHLSGVEFIFLKDYQLFLHGLKKNVLLPNDCSFSNFKMKLEEASIVLSPENLENIKIQAKADDGSGFTKSIKYFIDYVDDENHFLQDGKWFIFNQIYIDFLLKSVSNIDLETHKEYNFKSDIYKNWYNSLSDIDKKKWYSEKYFNDQMSSKHGFVNFDRDIDTYNNYKIEYMDLFKDDTFFYVKIGKPQKLNYAIDQSLATLKYLLENNMTLKINGNVFKPKTFCLWFVLDRVKEINSIIDINSFILLMKLNEWKKQLLNARIKPLIYISYSDQN